ncbi:hypothetical protein Tco_1581021, partial [Tanacetum coccineum]
TRNASNTVVKNMPSVLLVLSKAKPGFFVDAIQYLLVLATPTLLLLGCAAVEVVMDQIRSLQRSAKLK